MKRRDLLKLAGGLGLFALAPTAARASQKAPGTSLVPSPEGPTPTCPPLEWKGGQKVEMELEPEHIPHFTESQIFSVFGWLCDRTEQHGRTQNIIYHYGYPSGKMFIKHLHRVLGTTDECLDLLARGITNLCYLFDFPFKHKTYDKRHWLTVERPEEIKHLIGTIGTAASAMPDYLHPDVLQPTATDFIRNYTCRAYGYPHEIYWNHVPNIGVIRHAIRARHASFHTIMSGRLVHLDPSESITIVSGSKWGCTHRFEGPCELALKNGDRLTRLETLDKVWTDARARNSVVRVDP